MAATLADVLSLSIKHDQEWSTAVREARGAIQSRTVGGSPDGSANSIEDTGKHLGHDRQTPA